MECNIKIIKLNKVLPYGTYPKREYNVRYFYHRTDGCYYMYDEKGCETNLTTCGSLIPIDKELIVGSESLDSNTLVCIGLKANYVRPSANGLGCGCQDTYIKAWTYASDLKDFIETGGIDRKYYRVSLTPAPNEGGVVGCSGSAILPDEDSDGFRFSFESGSTVRVYAKPAPGYSFVGWKEYHTNEIISINPEWSFTIKKDMDLMGVFKQDETVHKTYYINCNASPSNAGYVVGAGRYEAGTRHTIIAQAIDGYNFINWKNSKGEIVSTISNYEFIVTKDETFTAYFELDTVSYKLDANIVPSGMATVQGLGNYNEGETATIKVIPNSLYDIESVTASSGTLKDLGNGNYSIVMNDNITITVKLVRTYTFTIVSNGNGDVRYKDLKGNWSNWSKRHSVRAPEMTVITIQGQADNNYEFDYWLNPEGARFEENQNNVIVNADVDNRTYTCYFKKTAPEPVVKRRVTITATNGKVMSEYLGMSRPSASNDSFEVDNGTDVKFSAFSDEGYTFKEWTINSVRHTDNPYTHKVTEDITVNAVFKEIPPEPSKDITFTIKATKGGKVSYVIDQAINNMTEHTVTCPIGTLIIIQSYPDENYEFDYWEILGERSEETAVFQKTVPAEWDNQTLIAHFRETTPKPSEEITFKLKASTGGRVNYITDHDTSIHPEMNVKCRVGELIILKAHPDENYEFDHWDILGDTSERNARIETHVQAEWANQTITAYFNYIQPDIEFDLKCSLGGTCTYKDENASVSSKLNQHHIVSRTNNNIVLTAYPLENYKFDYWDILGEQVTENPYTLVVADSHKGKQLRCHFSETAKPTFEVTIKDLTGATTFTGDGNYEEGSQCTINIKAKFGFKIESVRKNDEVIRLDSSGNYTFTVTENTEFIVDCRRAEYNVTCKINPKDSAKVTGTGSYNFGDSCTLTCTANQGYRIVSLQVNGDIVELNKGTYKFTVNGQTDCILTCEQLPKLPVTVQAVPDGSATFTGNGQYDRGESCTIHVDVKDNYVLKSITANGSPISLDGSGNYTFVVNTSTLIKVICEEKAPEKFTVSAQCTPSEGGVVNGLGQFNNGDRCTFTVVPNNGFDIESVKLKTSKGEVAISLEQDNTYNFQVEENVIVLVTFKAKPKIRITVVTTTGNTTMGFVGFDNVADSASKYIDVLPNTKVILFAKPQQGYKFRAWYDEDMVITEDESNASYTITATMNKTYKAEFLKDAYLDLSEQKLTFEASGGTKQISVSSNVNWTVS